eukprot:TRINITY_DN1630_c0_g1_i1.p1 TRINITY_DN1630_c0_g1~~TRINITY_DN1630_c0_g1_i1.p1  ORF type:complete len:667 (-),score=127.08 TRINITY_DN1630_c0_g1_i1:216-2216(-)
MDITLCDSFLQCHLPQTLFCGQHPKIVTVWFVPRVIQFLSPTSWRRSATAAIRMSPIEETKNTVLDSKSISRRITKLSFEATSDSISRAKMILRDLEDQKKLYLVDSYALEMIAASSAKAGDPAYGAKIIKLMLQRGLSPNVKAWSCVLSRLAKIPSELDSSLELFNEIVDQLREGKSRPDTGSFNAVLNGCAIVGRLKTAHQLFDKMTELGLQPDVLTYNILIKLYAKTERKDLLVGVLQRMLQSNVRPCVTTFHSLVAAFVGLGELHQAESLLEALKQGRLDICSVLRETLGTPVEAPATEGLLLPQSYMPDSHMYTTLMKGYMHKGEIDQVFKILRKMQENDKADCQPDEITYTTAISSFVRMGLMDEAHLLIRQMAEENVPANLVTYNVLLSGYCSTFQMEKASNLMKEMKDLGLGPDVVSYNILVNGYVNMGDFAGSLLCFNQMRASGIHPSHVSYTTLMKAFAKNNQPKLAEKVFKEMQNDEKVAADSAAWNMLIQSYCDAGLLGDAKEVFLQMKEEKLSPTLGTYGSLVNAFVRARRPGEVMLLWNEIKERAMEDNANEEIEPLVPDEALLDSIVVYFVKTAFFTKALEVIACMEKFKFPPKKTKYRRLFVELHSMIFTSKHKSEARRARRIHRKMAAEAFKFWLGLPNSYYSSEWEPY